MAALSQARLAHLLAPYLEAAALGAEPPLEQIARYLDLLQLWNGRTNLTAVRTLEELVTRQVGESLVAASLVPAATRTLLDFGSGAGFPGIPIALARPGLRVTLAESQGKKASFLREVVRALALPAAVRAGRVEEMDPSARFDVVTMRAVDRTPEMLPLATARVAHGGFLVRYLSEAESGDVDGWTAETEATIHGSRGRVVRLKRI